MTSKLDDCNIKESVTDLWSWTFNSLIFHPWSTELWTPNMVYLLSKIKGSRMNIKWSVRGSQHQRISDLSLIMDFQFFDLLSLVHRAMDSKYGLSLIKDQGIEDEHKRISDRSLINYGWSWSLYMELQFFDLYPWSIMGPLSYGLQIWLIFDQRSKDRGWKTKWLGLILDLWSFDLWIINHLIFDPMIFGLLILWSLILDHMIHRAMDSKCGWPLTKDQRIDDQRLKD